MPRRGVIQLLDSEQGHPLRSWPIEDRDQVTIGRAEVNDVVVTDPYVSRAHAYLRYDPVQDQWLLIAVSRQQVICRGKPHGELVLTDGIVFRLGPHGCYLRFDQSAEATDDRKTLSYDPATMPILMLDRQRMQREVEAIAESDYFQILKQAVHLRRGARESADTKLS